jgi:hypothetical protein
LIQPRVAVLLVILPLLLTVLAVDALAFRPPGPRPQPRLSGALDVKVLDDGILVISLADYEAGIYPLGRRFVPALP